MGHTVYIFSYQVAAVITESVDGPSAAAERLARMIRKLNLPNDSDIVHTTPGGLSLAFLMAHEDARLLDTHSINASMRVEAIARLTGADRYYTVDVHSHLPNAVPIVTPYVLRDNMVVADGHSDTLPTFVERHASGIRIRSIACPDGWKRLIHSDDVPRYLEVIDATLALPTTGQRRSKWLTEMRETLILTQG